MLSHALVQRRFDGRDPRPGPALRLDKQQHYRRAIAIDPEHADAHCNLGDLLENHKEDYGSAEQHYRRAIAIDPEHADAHCNLGDLLEKRKADCHSAAGQPRPSWCL